MIPRALRADTRRILAEKPRQVRFPWAVARFLPAEGEGGISIVVPKKAARRAVDRHRAKRRVGAALLATRKPGYDLVVTLQAAGTRARGARLRAWCVELWDRILESTHA